VTTVLAPVPLRDASALEVQRRLAAAVPEHSGAWLDSPQHLELSTLGAQDPPRLIAASLLEGKAMRAHEVEQDLDAHFAAFLDGTQASTVVAHADEIPVVHAVAAAVIRERADRRMRTWRSPLVHHAVYAPLALMNEVWRDALDGLGLPVVDTLAKDAESPHPFALQDAAIHAVQAERERVERELAESWCEAATGDLFIDGAITGSERVATSDCAVGVIKSHRTLYAEGEALRTVLRLRRGERTSVFRVTSPRRTPVASWYLRLRDPRGHDPLWGLVRVEVAEHKGAAMRSVASRADLVSRWVLAEALPLAVPDARWDKMVYGIRDCEEFLRAIR